MAGGSAPLASLRVRLRVRLGRRRLDRELADGLAVCPPHAWGCPVIMKVDPEQVAWTCGRCGEIATTHDHASRPA